MKLYQYDEALKYLKEMERIQEDQLDPDSRKLQKTKELIGAVNYQMLKFPGFIELCVRALTSSGGMRNPLNNTLCQCACVDPDAEELDLRPCLPKRPQISSKMSGHKVSYA